MWRPAPRSEQAEKIYRSAEKDREANPQRYDLSPEAVVATLEAKVGARTSDRGEWLPALEVYLASAREEGRLNALGMRNVAGSVRTRLLCRYETDKLLDDKPEIRARTIDRPIFVIGGWRTGTTLLQRLLSAIPGLRGALPSELSAPSRVHGLGPAERDAMIDAGGAAHALLHVLSPDLSTIHPSGARLEEECVLAMGADMRNWGFTSTLRCPSYASWLLTQDLTPSYRRYADVLRILQDESGRRWILKAPAHTAALDHLLTVFPDALVVHLHRDVVQTVTSGASLFATFRSIYSDAVDPVDVGRYQLDMTATWFERSMRAREIFPDAHIMNVAFKDLVADPIATARAICAAADVEWTPASDQVAAARLIELEESGQKPRHKPEDFGLDPEEVKARFRDYSAAFGLD